jgi:hypothetical protein
VRGFLLVYRLSLVHPQPAELRLVHHGVLMLSAPGSTATSAALRAQVLRAAAGISATRFSNVPQIRIPGLAARARLSMVMVRGRKSDRREERKAFESQFIKHGFSSFSHL